MMTAERWQQVKAVFEAVQGSPPGERGALLDAACAGDDALREEVVSLLAAHETPGAVDRLSDVLVAPLLRRLQGPPSAGRRVGNYEIVSEIGRGGMGVVYKARDLQLDRFVALKFLPADVSEHAEAKARFIAEARAASSLDHPSICTIHHVGETGEGQLYIVMPCYEGTQLKQRIAEGPLPVADCIDVARQLAEGLQCAHEAGILHRDIKPANVILTDRGQAKILDFGIAKLAEGDPGLTRTGARIGTVAYMAPEQVRGEPVDPRVDLWALGVVLYEMLTGRRPFEGGDMAATMYAILEHEPQGVSAVRPEIPSALERVVRKALAKRPGDRYQAAADLIEALDRAATGIAPQEPAPGLQGTVTFFFSDIEGSTRLLSQLGARYADVLAEQRQLVRSAFQQWGGREVDTAGDGFFAAFSRAHDAVAAAEAVQRAVADHAWPEGVAVRLRIGIHTGEPMAVEGEYAGLDVHRAARICAAAHGGQVLLSETTCQLVERDLPVGVRLLNLGRHRLKDIEVPEHLYQLVIEGLPGRFPQLHTLRSGADRLPVPATRLIGREQESAVLLRLLRSDAVRLVTLTGPGGTGKTRLALRAAADAASDFDDGVYFVSLTPVTNPEHVASSIAQALGVSESAAQTVPQQLQEYLRERSLLLVLDNFEQVVAAASLVAGLLAESPGLKLLVTSRVALRLRGEHEYPVPPLSLPDLARLPEPEALADNPAVALFVERAQSVRPGFSLTAESARAVAELCVRLDGLPLAIELAAARVKLFSPQAMLTRLGSRLDLLKSGSRDMPARHQTLRHAIAWSYDLLRPEEQRFFRTMSIFVGGCTLEAAEAVCRDSCDAPLDVVDELAALVDHSLLRQEEGRDGEPRFLMLETIRAYGLERLEQSGEAEGVRRAHAAYFLGLAERAEPELTRAELVVWLDRLETEHANLRAALTWTIGHDEAAWGLRLGAALWRFWLTRGHMKEGRQWLERLLALPVAQAPAPARVKALNGLGTLAHNQGDNAFARSLLEQSLEMCRRQGDRQGMAIVLNNLAWVACELSDFDRAQVLAVEGLALNRALDEKRGTALALNNLGWIANYRGEYAVASAYHQQSLALRREIGDRRGIAFALCNLAWSEQIHADYDRAEALVAEALSIIRAVNDKMLIGYALNIQGIIARSIRAYGRARQVLEEGISLWKEGSNLSLVAWALTALGYVHLEQSELRPAFARFEEGLAFWERIGARWGLALVMRGVGEALIEEGDYTQAEAQLRTSTLLYREIGCPLGLAESLEALADLEQGRERWARGVRFCAAAAQQRDVLEAPLPACRRERYARLLAKARTALGEDAFAAAWHEGQALGLEPVVAYALDERNPF